MKTLRFFSLLVLILLMIKAANAQNPKWVLGSSQQDASNAFYGLGTNHLKFYEVDFTGPSPVSTPRTIGASINAISTYGTQDVINNALDANNNVLFYVFDAARIPWTSGSLVVDTIYFAAYNSSTNADEVFGRVATVATGASVIESELVRKPGSSTEYYFIYKTNCLSNANGDIRYVTIDAIAHTVSAPTNIVTAEKHGEGMAVSQLDCASNQRWFFFSRPESNGNVTLRRCAITSTGISAPTDLYTISIPNNGTIVVVGGIEIAPTNNYLSIANYSTASSTKDVILFDYDNSTGNVSNERSYNVTSGYPAVTSEFSPNGTRLYILQGGSGSFPNVIYNCPTSPTNYSVTSTDQVAVPLTGCLTLETAYDGNIYTMAGPNNASFYILHNVNTASVTVTSTSSTFFGPDDRIGTGLPDQVDGETGAQGNVTAQFTSSASTICVQQAINFTSTSLNATAYSWDFGDGNFSTNQNPTNTYTVSGTYTVSLVAANNCGSDTTTQVITVNNLPVAQITGPFAICSGQSIILTGSGGGTYQWSGGTNATTSSVTVSPSSTTAYYLTVSNGSCTSLPDTFIVNVHPVPVVNAGNDTTICSGDSVQLNGIVIGASSYIWGPSTFLSNTNILNPYASPTSTMTYILDASNSFDCSTSDTIVINVQSCTGIKENELNTSAFTIYPNPSGGQIEIITEKEFFGKCIVSVFDPEGQLVYREETANSGIVHTDLSRLAKGTYFIKLESGDMNATQKIILQ